MKSLVDEIKLMIKPISYFIGGMFLFSIFLALISNDNSNNQAVKNNKKDSEYMKILGDIKWTDDLKTWKARLPNCPIKNIGNSVTFPYDYEYSKEYIEENCSIKIGGINMLILTVSPDDELAYRYNNAPVILKGLDAFPIYISIKVSENDSYYITKILNEKYGECSIHSNVHNECSDYATFDFYGKYITIYRTNLTRKLILEHEKEVYESQIKSKAIDPTAF